MRKGLIGGLLFLFSCTQAHPYCGPDRLICAEYAGSGAVVEARLVDSKHHFPKNHDGQDWHIYTLEVLKVYKGEIDRSFRIREYNDSSRAGFDWKRGDSYLLFLKRHSDGTWWPYGCGNSDLLRKSTRTIEVINSLSKRTGGLIQGSISGVPLGPNNIKIRVDAKEGKQYFTGRVDENGLFKIHVPAGHYRVHVVLDGWKFERDRFMSYEDPTDLKIENGWCAQLVFQAAQESR